MGELIFIEIIALIIGIIKDNAESKERKRQNPYIPGKTDMDEWILMEL